jgi:hypothetical protein
MQEWQENYTKGANLFYPLYRKLALGCKTPMNIGITY